MSRPHANTYQTRSPILFLIFNRPETTQRVFDQIRIAQPPRLYIAADGPREGWEDDVLRCRQAREVVTQVDWNCEVKKLFNQKNRGCREGVSTAINWFFETEEEGIILEDDCLPAKSFFRFCDVMLDKYRYDTRIRHITGCNLQFGKKWGNGSYYFSNRVHVWGWAAWRRVWSDYDIDIKQYERGEVIRQLKNIYQDDLIAEAWTHIFDEVKAGKVNSWAYPLDFINFFNNGLVVIPNQNLISNIGFNANATNTLNKANVYANIQLVEMNEIHHPVFIVPEKEADLSIMNRDFNISEKRRKLNSTGRRMKRWFRQVFKAVK